MDIEEAIRLLEITQNPRLLTEDELTQIRKRAIARWHPDKVERFREKEPEKYRKYEENFKNIDLAIETIQEFLAGAYHEGVKVKQQDYAAPETTEEVLRSEAPRMQERIREIWQKIVASKFKHHEENVVLSDGFKIKDLLFDDLKDDAPTYSLVALIYTQILFGIGFLLGSLLGEVGMYVVVGVWFLFALCCLLMFLPLARIWLPPTISDFCRGVVNFGWRFAAWLTEDLLARWPLVNLIVMLPMLVVLLVKYVVLYPLYWIAGLIIGDRKVGRVVENVSYYAGGAEWYIQELINKSPSSLTEEQLFHLSHFYSEFSDFNSKE